MGLGIGEDHGVGGLGDARYIERRSGITIIKGSVEWLGGRDEIRADPAIPGGARHFHFGEGRRAIISTGAAPQFIVKNCSFGKELSWICLLGDVRRKLGVPKRFGVIR